MGEVVLKGAIAKVDEPQRLAFGWASVVSVDGAAVVDAHGDRIEPTSLERAAYSYAETSRSADARHEVFEGVGDLVESVYLDDAKLRAMGIDPAAVSRRGWWTGFRVSEKYWPEVASGQLKEFSIVGTGRHIDGE